MKKTIKYVLIVAAIILAIYTFDTLLEIILFGLWLTPLLFVLVAYILTALLVIKLSIRIMKGWSSYNKKKKWSVLLFLIIIILLLNFFNLLNYSTNIINYIGAHILPFIFIIYFVLYLFSKFGVIKNKMLSNFFLKISLMFKQTNNLNNNTNNQVKMEYNNLKQVNVDETENTR